VFLPTEGPPPPEALQALRHTVRHQLRDVAERIRWEAPCTAVATSRTFQQLARLCGAAPRRDGPFVERVLGRDDLAHAVDALSRLPAAERAQLPGISAPRAAQSLAGAVVGHTAMKLSGIPALTICPWAIREGILLRTIEDGLHWWDALTAHDGNDDAEPRHMDGQAHRTSHPDHAFGTIAIPPQP
jgi:exopolyphosphatase/guanosine-5'-triphosphate,3'-diphosphate pyrophosphatase